MHCAGQRVGRQADSRASHHADRARSAPAAAHAATPAFMTAAAQVLMPAAIRTVADGGGAGGDAMGRARVLDGEGRGRFHGLVDAGVRPRRRRRRGVVVWVGWVEVM